MSASQRNTKVVIKTRDVGQNFGCVGIVHYVSNGHKIHETRIAPYGFDSAVYRIAEEWAQSNGYSVIESRERS